MNSIKSKITLGISFMFTVIVILSVLGILFINQLSQKAKGTIKENYHSIEYTINMTNSLNEIQSIVISRLLEKGVKENAQFILAKNIKSFEDEQKKESENITEKGERDLVDDLYPLFNDYVFYISKFNNSQMISNEEYEMLNKKYLLVRNKILDIYRVNMDAIRHKTERLQTTADDVTLYMTLVATISILITLSFIFTFPSSIAEPIKELTEKIKSISERKYDQRLEIKSKDELGELASAFNNMVERLETYEEKHIDQLLFEQKRLETVVQNIEDGILFIDETQKIVLANNTILQITGLKEDQILYNYIPGVSAKNDLVKELYKISISKLANENSDISPLRITLDGKEYFFNVEVEEIITYSKSWKKDTFIGTLILLRNITEYQERDKAKTNLLATVSHELKTPLSSINLSLKLLDDKRLGELNPDQKEIINSLKQQSSRLSKVIKEILDYSQIETGNIRLNFDSVKPEVVTDIGITALMMQLSEKEIELRTNLQNDLLEINADLEKLVFVFINLLNNAIRYSNRRGEITIDVCMVKNEVQFSIADNGPGISEDDLQKLFQRFTQVGEKYSHGWGLGLAISKEFVLAQGGRIWAESTLGVGSKFFFTIPATKNKTLA